MAKKLKQQRSGSKQQQVTKRLTTWSRAENTPFAHDEYPFELAIAAGEYSDILQMDLGPGIILHPSTICLSRQGSDDATVLALMGEHFREFYPGEMPWLSKRAEHMYEAMMINGQDEEDIKAFEESLNYWVEQGLLDVDHSVPHVYCYRLNVEAVRTAKNARFKPLNPLEVVHRDYPRRFPTFELQQAAFALMCEKSRYQSIILLAAWHLGLGETPWLKRHREGQLSWLSEQKLLHAVSDPLEERDKIQQAIERLLHKGLLLQRGQGSRREYRVHAERMWAALCALPEPLSEIEAMEGHMEPDE